MKFNALLDRKMLENILLEGEEFNKGVNESSYYTVTETSHTYIRIKR
jgi:hypothetical protein